MKFSTKTLTRLFSVVAITFASTFSFAQDSENLVPNGSFESVDKKPKRLGSIENATGWVSPTGVRADLFTSSKVLDIDVPLNVYGKEEGKEDADGQKGGNYAGIIAYAPSSSKMKRSYIMIKLDSPLKKGMKYCVKFNVSLAEASKYAINNVGLMLTKKPFGTDSKTSIIEDEVSLMHFDSDTKVISARYGWTEVCGTFEAKGGEKYLTIGNFSGDDRDSGELKRENMKKDKEIKVAQLAMSYYFLDEISVKLIDTDKDEFCDCERGGDNGDEYSTMIYVKIFNFTKETTIKEKVEMQEVYFAFGRSKMTTEGLQSLDTIVKILKENPEMKLQVNGHNNEMEDEVAMNNDYYADMDSKRVAVVMDYLKANGIEEARLILTLKGSESKNAAINEEDEEELQQAKNRRVTFKLR